MSFEYSVYFDGVRADPVSDSKSGTRDLRGMERGE